MCCIAGIVPLPDNRDVCRCWHRARPHRFGRRYVSLSLQSGLPDHFPPTLHLPPGRLATENLLPSMVGGMTFFHRNENSAARCADFSTSGECSFNGYAIIC